MTFPMRTTRTLSIRRAVPPSVTREALLSYLHDHGRMLLSQPNVSSYKEQSRPSSSSPSVHKTGNTQSRSGPESITGHGFLDEALMRVYEIKEDVPLIGAIHFKAAFQNEPDGLKTVAAAPMGLIMKEHYQVVEPGFADSEKHEATVSTGRLLVETCHITVNMLVMPFVEWQFKKAHEIMLDKIINELSQQ
jgi:hypothetical protein